MSVMIEKDIVQALQTATLAAVAASTLPALPVKALGRTFVPPNDQKWLEIVHVPNNPQGDYWANSKNYRGMMRLILHWPNDDQGVYPPLSVIQSVVSFFDKGKTLDANGISVNILENPNYLGEIVTSTDSLYPVSVRYHCFVP